MNFKSLFIFLLLVLFSFSLFPQEDTNTIHKGKVLLISSGLGAALAGSYLYIENTWWADQQIPFHFDNGQDFKYALNVDKAGHFMGGIVSTELFSNSMNWAGMNKKKSLWYGAFFGSGLQLAIEMKDAYAPYWGFSKWDLALGSMGSFWPVAQYYNDDLKSIAFKFSYYKRSNIYWELEEQRGKEVNKYAWQDDYPNQTYWVTFDINHFFETCCWPDWLNVAIGFGLDDTQYLSDNDSKLGGNNEWYIALDYDIPKMLNKWDSSIAKKLKYWLNYVHFPAPTIRISPTLEFYPLFF